MPYDGQYTLQWVDDENALIIFTDAGAMFKALKALSGGPFKIKQFQDANPQGDERGNLVLGPVHASVSGGFEKPSTVESDEMPSNAFDAEFVPVGKNGAHPIQFVEEQPVEVKNRFETLLEPSSSSSVDDKADEKAAATNEGNEIEKEEAKTKKWGPAKDDKEESVVSSWEVLDQ
jgi:hypothetical protein